jgi:hypothetical protein
LASSCGKSPFLIGKSSFLSSINLGKSSNLGYPIKRPSPKGDAIAVLPKKGSTGGRIFARNMRRLVVTSFI